MARILVVDDEQQVGNILELFLRREHEVIRANDGKRALAILLTHPVDVVITDIYMPGTDGLELIRELARTQPSIAIIAMSGQWGKFGAPLTALALTFGADHLLSKPFSCDEALDAVSTVLKMRKTDP